MLSLTTFNTFKSTTKLSSAIQINKILYSNNKHHLLRNNVTNVSTLLKPSDHVPSDIPVVLFYETPPIALLESPRTNKFTSGLMSISPQEYQYLQEVIPTPEGLAYKFTVKTLLTKILYMLYATNQNLPLGERIALCFTEFPLNTPNILPQKKLITMTQHFLTYILHNVNLSYEEYKDYCKPFITEAFIAKKNLLNPLIDRPYTKYYLVNPENLHETPGFSNLKCLEDTGQRNSDIFRQNVSFGKVINYYDDVKTNSTAGFTGRNLLSIIPGSKKELLKTINNITTTLQALREKTLDIFVKEKLNQLSYDIKALKKSQGPFDITDKKIHNLLLKLKYDSFYQDVRVSTCVPLDPDTTQFPVILNKIMDKLIKSSHAKDHVDSMFPSTCEIDYKERDNIIDYTLDYYFVDEPEVLKTIKDNMKSRMLLTND